MKYGLPIALIVLVVAVAGLRRGEVRPRTNTPRRTSPAELEPLTAAGSEPTPTEMTVPAIPPRGEAARPIENRRGMVLAPAWQRLSQSLDREVGLREFQRELVSQVLREREVEIQAWHQAIRKAGVLDVPEYEWRMACLKAEWYRRIDAHLDAAQHSRFDALMEKGFFNEDLIFRLDPGMAVLE